MNSHYNSERAVYKQWFAEMSAVVKICGALSMRDVVGWNEDTGEVAIEDADRRLEGKAVYDTLFLEAADYVLMQSLSRNTEKAGGDGCSAEGSTEICRHVMRMSQKSRGKKKLRRKFQRQSRKIYLKNRNGKKRRI